MISETLSKTILKHKTILILGNGYIGFELFKHLTVEKHDVTIVDRKSLDYHDSHTLWKYIINNDIGTIINTFGFTGTPNIDEAESRKEDCWNLNVVVPQKVASLCERAEVRYIHISSGCIYSGYEYNFSENYTPNFGLFDDSSFYSKSKHAFETLTRDLKMKLLRIRMPVSDDIESPRNYLKKIMDYPNLIDFKNSKTYIPDLCGFVNALIINPETNWNAKQDIYNVVNPDPLTTKEVIQKLNDMNLGGWKKLNPNWVDVKSLKMAAPRSNCILDNHKASGLHPFLTETQFMNGICNKINGVCAS